MLARRKLPPLNALRAFDAAGRRLNFREAADELGVTQGAVAQQVRALESHLGLPLFHRRPRGLELTSLGQSYLRDINKAFDTLAEATESLAKRPNGVTISVTPTVATRILLPRMGALHSAIPDIELRTIADEDLPDFDTTDVDMAIGLATGPFPPEIEAVSLIRQDLIAVASPQLIANAALPLAADDMMHLPLIHHCMDSWPRFLGTTHPLSGPRYSLTTLAIDAALAGQGAIVTSVEFVSGDLETGRLLRLSDHSVRIGPDYYLVRRRSKVPHPAADAVWDWCLRNLIGNV